MADHDGTIEIYWLVYISHGGNQNQQKGCVPLMYVTVM